MSELITKAKKFNDNTSETFTAAVTSIGILSSAFVVAPGFVSLIGVVGVSCLSWGCYRIWSA